MHKGKPVIDLKKEDFVVYENKKRVDINGFFIKRKQLSLTDGTPTLYQSKEKKKKDRAFVLVFSIIDFNSQIQEAIDLLFGKILKPNDRLLIFANDRTLTHPDISDGLTIKQQLIAHLREESPSPASAVEYAPMKWFETPSIVSYAAGDI